MESRGQRSEVRKQRSEVRGQRSEVLSSDLCSLSSAFTLVEIIIALAILAMILASTFTIFSSSSKSWQKGEDRSERYHTARVAMGRMSMEISQAIMNGDTRCRFIGTQSEIKFVSFVSASSGVFELAEIEYWMDSDQGFVMRNEDIDPDYDFSTQEQSDILADNISKLEFSYYDGLSWSNEWDSEVRGQKSEAGGQGILPKAVKIKIKVENKHGRESEDFETVTHLKTA